jgi:hypothetical protein
VRILPFFISRPLAGIPQSPSSGLGVSVAIARIHALAGVRPAVRLALSAGVLIIGVAIVLRSFAFAFMGILGEIVAGFGLA